jgi:hypothetical protein
MTPTSKVGVEDFLEHTLTIRFMVNEAAPTA